MESRLAAALVSAGMLLAACGGSSSPATAPPPFDPAPPGFTPSVPFNGVAGGGIKPDTVGVGWSHEGFRSGYEIQWRVGDGPWQQRVLRTGVDAESSAVFVLGSDIPIGTHLGFRIRAQYRDAWSAWSPEVSTVRPRAVASPLTSKAETAGKVRIDYAWGWVSSLSPSAPDLRLYAGDHLVAHMGPTPWASFEWDTFTFPEGDHDYNLRTGDGQAGYHAPHLGQDRGQPPDVRHLAPPGSPGARP